VRCLLGAGATGVITPMIDAMGRGWCFTFISLFLVATSPLLWWVYFQGMEMREGRRLKDERKEREKEEKRDWEGKVEEGRRSVGSGNAQETEREKEKTTVPEVEGGVVEMQAVQEKEREKDDGGEEEEEREGEEGPDAVRHQLSRVLTHDSGF